MAEFMLGGQKSVIDNSPGAQTFHAEKSWPQAEVLNHRSHTEKFYITTETNLSFLP